jgi:DNA polymerase III alpha subunit|tara:strand:- start:1734 stop:2312 length:579 start_codon:yes stop_codon:yes gene_type:complete
MPDIDIDFKDREKALALFKHVRASRIDDGELTKHNTGVYMHEVPTDPSKYICSIEHKEAEEQGLFKIDFLNVSLYNDIKNEEHLVKLTEKEPLWELLTEPDFSNKLFHVGEHSGVLKTMKPQTVEQLAAVLAMIRPAKRHLIGQPWDTVMSQVWTKPTNGEYYFKKSHATAYAVAVVVNMNLICEQYNELGS